MSDQFFDKGWCWMSHPDWNNGNAIPVFMYEANGDRFYVPLDPSEGGEFSWDERAAEWEMIESARDMARRVALMQDLEDELRSVCTAYASLLQSDYQTRGNPDPVATDPFLKSARAVLARVGAKQ